MLTTANKLLKVHLAAPAVLVLICLTAIRVPAARQRQGPDIETQREAMAKLAFLVGRWSGEASVTEGAGEPIKVLQSEDAQSKLNGLVLLLEGTGRNPKTGNVVFSALATVSYDEASRSYRFRSHSGGRYLDTELKVRENGFEWGYEAGPASVRNVMELNGAGEWVEYSEVKIGANPPRRTLQMTVRREK
jgi:hypothetical protein